MPLQYPDESMKGRPITHVKAFLRVVCLENAEPFRNRGSSTRVLFVRVMEDGTEDVIDLSKELRITDVLWKVESRQHQSRLEMTVMGAQVFVEEPIDDEAVEHLHAQLVVSARHLKAEKK